MGGSRSARIVVVLALMAATFAGVTTSVWANHGTRTLQVHRERSTVVANGETTARIRAHLHGGGTLLDPDAPAPAGGIEVDFEVVDGPGDRGGVGSEFGSLGYSPFQPDLTCTIAAGSRECAVFVPAGSTLGVSNVRAWIDHDTANTTVEADPSEARLADKSTSVPPATGTDCEDAEDGTRAACEAGTAEDGVTAEPDITDVVEVNYISAPTALDCTPEPAQFNNLDNGRITCLVTDQFGNEVSGIRVDGENQTGSVNDPDDGNNDTNSDGGAENDADYFPTSSFCVTDANGRCTGTVPTEGQQGTAVLCFWADLDSGPNGVDENQYEADGTNESDGGKCDVQDVNGDLTDIVSATWNSNNPATTTTSTSTTTTSTSTTSTSTTSTSTTSTTSTSTTSTSTTTTTQPQPPADPSVRTGGAGRDDRQMWIGNGFGAPFRAQGGVLIAGPALTGAHNGTAMIAIEVVTGTDNALYVRRDSSGGAFQRLSNAPTFCKGAPGALVYLNSSGAQVITVACRGSDDALWYATASQPTNDQVPLISGGWQSLGGKLEAGPAVGIVQGKLTFAVTGVGGRIWLNDTLQGGNTNFTSTPWTCIGRPAIGSKPQARVGTSTGTAYFGCHGTDHALWVSRNVAGSWATTFSRGGTLREGVSAAVSTQQAVFFVRGTDDAIYQTTVYNGNFAPKPFSANRPSFIAFDPGGTALT